MDKDIRDAIACVTVPSATGGSRGTGFLVAPDLAVTALHVVADRTTDPPTWLGPIELLFPGGLTVATVVDRAWDRISDCVLLRCATPPKATPIPLRDLQRSADKWETHGWANMESVDGLVVDGDVTNHAGELNKILAIQLYSKQLAAAGSSANGLSGAPVIINKMVAGVLRSALGKKDLVVGGTVYACPIAVVAAFQPAQLAVRSMPKIATFLTPDQLATLQPLFVAEFAAQLAELTAVLLFSLGAELDQITNPEHSFEVVVSDLLSWIHNQGKGPMEIFLHVTAAARPDGSPIREFCQKLPGILDPVKIEALVQDFNDALNALGNIANQAVARDVVSHYRNDFAATLQQIDILDRYKSLHNCLHDVQMKLEAIADALGRPGTDARANGSLRKYAVDLAKMSQIARARIDGLPTEANEENWLNVLDQTIEEMRNVAQPEATDEERAEALGKLKALLKEASSINSNLTAAATNLGLASFSEMLSAALENLAPGDDVHKVVTAGAAGVGALRACIAGLVHEHFEWQVINNALGYADLSPTKHQPVARIPKWTRFSEKLTRLCDVYPREPWSKLVKDSMANWIDKTPNAKPDDTERTAGSDAFFEFNRECTHRFYEVDSQLKELTGKLTQVAVPIRRLLTTVTPDGGPR